MTHSDLHSQYSRHYSSAYRTGDVTAYPPADFLPPRSPVSPMVAPKAQRVPVAGAQPGRRRRVKTQHPLPKSRGVLLAGGGMLALAALVVVPQKHSDVAPPVSNVCQQKVDSRSVLSRAELSELLTIPEQSPQQAVQAVIDAPYCTLPPVAVREGAIAERAAYPLEFDPQTWFIVTYKDGKYAGFDFSFHRD